MSRITVWRICHKEFSDSAFSGRGAFLYGGRFNSEGISAVYTAGSLSLGMLEMLVRSNNRSSFLNYEVFKAEIPIESIFEPNPGELPSGWDNLPHGMSSQNFGDAWIQTSRHLAMKVPSVVVSVEHNYILNPNHKEFERIEVVKMDDIIFDKRLF